MQHRFASNIFLICTIFLLAGAWLATPALAQTPPTANDFEFFAKASSGQTFGGTVCDTTTLVCRLTGEIDETTYMFAQVRFERQNGANWEDEGGDQPQMDGGFLTVSYPWGTPPDKNDVAVAWRAKIEVDDINAMITTTLYKQLSLTPNNTIVKATGAPIILHDSADTSHTISYTISHYSGSGITPTFDVTTKIYNLSGSEVASLTQNDVGTGAGSVTWDTNLPQTDGIYTYKITAAHNEFIPPPEPCYDADKSALLTPAVDDLYYFGIGDDGQGGHEATCVLKYTLNRAAGACEFKIYGTDFSGPTEVTAPSLASGTHYTSPFTIPVTVDANGALTGQYYAVVFASENATDAANNRDQLAKPALQKGTTNLQQVSATVTSLGFTGDHHFKIWSSGTAVDPADTTPIWGTMDDHGVCYTKNTPPTMFATFSVAPDIGITLTGVSVRAKVYDAVADTDVIVGTATGATLSGTVIEDGTDGDVDGIGSGSAIPNSNGVKTLNTVFKFEYSIDGTIWAKAGSTTAIPMYFTESTPLDTNDLYELALQKACGYVNGATDIQTKISAGMDGDIYYDPAADHYHDLSIFSQGEGECCCHAIVFCQLCRAVGIDAVPKYIWAGCASDTYCKFRWAYIAYQDRYVPMQLEAPNHDDADADPHFTYHVQALSGGEYYDPSYGTTGLPTLLETAPEHPILNPIYPAASIRIGNGLAGLTEHDSGWTCPHYP